MESPTKSKRHSLTVSQSESSPVRSASPSSLNDPPSESRALDESPSRVSPSDSPVRLMDRLRRFAASPQTSEPNSLSNSPNNSFHRKSPASMGASPVRSSSSRKTPVRFQIEANDIVLHEIIGQGGSATVYRGTVHNAMSVAVKVYQVLDKDSRDLVEKEISLVKSFNHINVLGLIDACELSSRNEYYFMMELCPETLRQLLNKRHEMSVFLTITEVKEYLVQIINGLKYLHELQDPVIHGDLKSQNVFAISFRDTEVPLLKIADFGESIGLSAKKRPNIGTIEFRAPEVFAPKSDDSIEYGTEIDIWSLGMTLYELLTLRIPFRSGSYQKTSLTDKIVKGARPLGLESLGNLSIFRTLFENLTEFDKTKRPSAKMAIQQLRDIKDTE